MSDGLARIRGAAAYMEIVNAAASVKYSNLAVLV